MFSFLSPPRAPGERAVTGLGPQESGSVSRRAYRRRSPTARPAYGPAVPSAAPGPTAPRPAQGRRRTPPPRRTGAPGSAGHSARRLRAAGATHPSVDMC
ncbi:hypothetical protein SXIM_00004 [Streptomyces xiamenensis]|uniref:Uncharacterized protein n=1 Tax=Streptomyces xiamenensis TaxID=408015 RepID=A0A0R8LD37_9ACTN|nr:hypothetical protein SXIM_00004 [Streptomyces xiamenensis]